MAVVDEFVVVVAVGLVDAVVVIGVVAVFSWLVVAALVVEVSAAAAVVVAASVAFVAEEEEVEIVGSAAALVEVPFEGESEIGVVAELVLGAIQSPSLVVERHLG